MNCGVSLSMQLLRGNGEPYELGEIGLFCVFCTEHGKIGNRQEQLALMAPCCVSNFADD